MKFLIGILVLVSTMAYGAERSYFIKAPSLGEGVYFSMNSNATGICKALNYERGVPGSMRYSEAFTGRGKPLVIVNHLGVVVEGVMSSIDTYYLWAQAVQSVVCINKIEGPQNIMRLINSPTHPDSNSLFSLNSDENGVCKVLGFSSAAVGSAFKSKRHTGKGKQLVTVNSDGYIVSASTSRNDYFGNQYQAISGIVCIEED